MMQLLAPFPILGGPEARERDAVELSSGQGSEVLWFGLDRHRQLFRSDCSALHSEIQSPLGLTVMGSCLQAEQAACSDAKGLGSRQPEIMFNLSFPHLPSAGWRLCRAMCAANWQQSDLWLVPDQGIPWESSPVLSYLP